MKKNVVGYQELYLGKKRVNLTLSLMQFDDLFICAEFKNIPFTTLAQSWVIEKSREEAKKILKNGYIPIAQRDENLFSQKGK